MKGVIYKEHSRHLAGEFDTSGDYIYEDGSRPDVKPSDLKKYFMGMFNKEEIDRLTPEDYKKISSKEFDQLTWNSAYPWNHDVQDLDPELTLNEPDLQSPAVQQGYPYWKQIFGDLSPEKVEKEIPPPADPFDKPNK